MTAFEESKNMSHRDAQPSLVYLKDYRPPHFTIDKTDLKVDIFEGKTRVTATLQMRRNPATDYSGNELVLHGQQLKLLELEIDGARVPEAHYKYDGETLVVQPVTDSFQLTSRVEIVPEENTALEGLYRSRTMYCTQCEAEGFRRITFYLDRPDVLAEFTTTISADRGSCPVLLANGNRTGSGELEDGRHWATWHDPFPKPCYLFALVAGDLERIDESFTTASGRQVALHLFVEEKDLDKCDHAIASLKNAMSWDERVYGREYDLDVFMIVAVDDFNMGAMENKGLNIFNTSCVLAHPDITTDMGFQRVEGVVAHEYFHNWSGNRVTCRDWFQLSLKEGFTVFRDAEFSADMGSRTVKRVDDVALLRTLQFAEDGGPTAHPVQPASYMEISNFYTLTIYEKGAEVVRMIRALLGEATFRSGSDLYFERQDGQAATIEDFVAAMADVSGRDFTQFMNWYRQAGTPRLAASGDYDAESGRYTLSFEQSCPPTPEAEHKQPFQIPVRLGLVGKQGDLALTASGETELVAEINQAEQQLVFDNISEPPVPSLLRGFSAPVKLSYPYTADELTFLISHDSDGFNRWNAAQQLSLLLLKELVAALMDNRPLRADGRLSEAFGRVLQTPPEDRAMMALLLTLPSEAYMSEDAEVIQVEAIHLARQFLRRQLAVDLRPQWLDCYRHNRVADKYRPISSQIGSRAMANLALAYLLQTGSEEYYRLAADHYRAADNITDRMAAIGGLINCDNPQAQATVNGLLDDFYSRWQGESLAVNQWFQVQATSCVPGGLERVRGLMGHAAFDISNPNKIRAVIGAFTSANPINFHREDGSGYEFLAEQVQQLDSRNPQIASRLLTPLTKWRKYPEPRSGQMRVVLEQLIARPSLSKDVFEIVSKSLK